MSMPGIRRVPALLASRRTALALMALFLASLVVQAVVPQEGSVSPFQETVWRTRNPGLAAAAGALGLTRVASTPWFWALGAALAASLGTCTARRAVQAGKRGRGPWGSIAFHAGLVVLIAGAMLSAGTRFVGFVELAPGQALTGEEGYLARRADPLAPGAPELSVAMDDLVVAFWPDGTVREVRAPLTVYGPGGSVTRGVARRTGAVEAGGWSVALGSRLGPAALLAYTPAGGSRPLQGYVHLPVDGEVVRTRVTVPGSGATARVALLGPWRGVLEGARPRDALTVRVRTAEGGRFDLRPGETAPFAGGTLRFVEVRPWALLMVRRDPGFPVLVAGGAVALLGLAAALLRAPRRVRVAQDGERVRTGERTPAGRAAPVGEAGGTTADPEEEGAGDAAGSTRALLGRAGR